MQSAANAGAAQCRPWQGKGAKVKFGARVPGTAPRLRAAAPGLLQLQSALGSSGCERQAGPRANSPRLQSGSRQRAAKRGYFWSVKAGEREFAKLGKSEKRRAQGSRLLLQVPRESGRLGMLLPGERWWQCRWQRVPAGSASLPAAPRAPSRCSAGSGAAGCVLLQGESLAASPSCRRRSRSRTRAGSCLPSAAVRPRRGVWLPLFFN